MNSILGEVAGAREELNEEVSWAAKERQCQARLLMPLTSRNTQFHKEK